MRRAVLLLHGPHLVPYHEWHLREPMLINYEGWRVLDNVKMTNIEAYTWDLGGTGRHLDPIIDDPRLTHRQRVCRLYRWSLKEVKSYVSKMHSGKFNLAYKVVRNRFEKYRYVTDPAMCDMMVRETQKYLRDTCNPHFLRNDHRNPNGPQNYTNPMFHPDNCLVYDHWTPAEVFWYDDAKMHRYASHHPNNSGTYENHERYGDIYEFGRGFGGPILWLFICCYAYLMAGLLAIFHDDSSDDEIFEQMNKYYDVNMRHAIEAEERTRRAKFGPSFLGHNWDQILGIAYPVAGYFKMWPDNISTSRNLDVDPRYNQKA